MWVQLLLSMLVVYVLLAMFSVNFCLGVFVIPLLLCVPLVLVCVWHAARFGYKVCLAWSWSSFCLEWFWYTCCLVCFWSALCWAPVLDVYLLPGQCSVQFCSACVQSIYFRAISARLARGHPFDESRPGVSKLKPSSGAIPKGLYN
jgi:hypothetical protein